MTNNRLNDEAAPTSASAAAPFRQVIAIDGPAAAGKTTVARAVADRLGATLFDTGVLYRTITLVAIRKGISDSAADTLTQLAGSAKIDVRSPSVDDGRLYDVLLEGDDVTWAIRGKDVEARVSAVSAVPTVRDALLPVQRRIAANQRIVMVGRDIGSVVLPEAAVKVYLDASVEERSHRRARELAARGEPVEVATIMAAMQARDEYDSNRETAPLQVAEDAVVIDTDGRSVESIVDEILAEAASRGFNTPAVAHNR